MKKAVVSLAAVLMLMASLAPAALAGKTGSASNAKGSITLSVVNDVVAVGEDLQIRASITMNSDGSRARKAVAYRIFVESEDGFAFPINMRQGVKFMRAGTTKSMSSSYEINERAREGNYVIRVQATLDGAPIDLGVPITIVK